MDEAKLRVHDEDFREAYGFGLPLPLPTYRSGSLGVWSLMRRPAGLGSSYTATSCVEPAHVVLHEGERPWMATNLLELESHAWHVRQARGTVVVGGLGMGVFAHAVARKPDVDRLIVVEQSPDVVRLLQQSTGFSEAWTGADKIEVILGDMLDPKVHARIARLAPKGINYLFVDIWDEYPSPLASEQMRALSSVLKPAAGGWWGQEAELAVRCEQRGVAITADTIHEFLAQHGLAADVDDGYVAFCRDVAMALDLEPQPLIAGGP